MAGLYKKAVVWLGLNEEYPDQNELRPASDETVAPRPERSPQRPPTNPDALRERASAVRAESRGENSTGVPAVPNTGPQSPSARPARAERGSPLTPASSPHLEPTVKAIPMDDDPTTTGSPSTVTVKSIPALKTAKPTVIVPKSFNDAQRVADLFREPSPVIVNMQNAERDLARRLIDFSSGLCYGLGGQMEKVAKDVYLLTPTELEVATEDRTAY